jgi:hypothetical protein
MKIILIAAAITAAATCASAQNYGFDMYLRGGAGLPDAPNAYARDWQAGPQIGTGFEFTLTQYVSMGAGFGYLRNTVKKDHLLDGTDGIGANTSGGTLDMYSGVIFINYRLFGMVAHTFPYITVDGGIAHLRISDQLVGYPPSLARPDKIIAGSSETAFQSSLGLGIDVPLSANIAFSFDAKYAYVFTQGDRRGYLPIEAGFKFVF